MSDRAELAPMPELDLQDLRPDLLVRLGAHSLEETVRLGILTPDLAVTRAGALCTQRELGPPHPLRAPVLLRRFEQGAPEVQHYGLPPVEEQPLEGPLGELLESLVGELLVVGPLHTGPEDLRSDLLRELLVNAVGHRSLTDEVLEEPVLVEVFSDELRVTSPGGLCPEVSLAEGRLHGRWSRNPALMTLLGRLGLARQQGLGLARVLPATALTGCRLDLVANLDQVIAHVVVDPALVLANVRPPAAERRQQLPKSLRHQRLLRALSTTPAQTRRELAGRLQCPGPTVRGDLRELIKRELVAPTNPAPRAPNQSYRLTPAGRRALADG